MTETNPVDDRGKLTRTLFPDGAGPDPRFTLANERTFLAWIRTSLAFLAGGIALEALGGDAISGALRTCSAVILVIIGLLIAAGAVGRWWHVETSMRKSRPLPAPGILPVLSAAIAVIIILLLTMILE